MHIRIKALSGLAVVGLAASSAFAAPITNVLAVGENRNAVYELSYTGDPTVAADWSSTVSLYRTLTGLASGELLDSVAADSAGNLYLSTIGTVPRHIFKIDTSGNQTTLATENVGAAATAGWTNAGAGGLAIGPDGKLYFGTTFNQQGIYRLNTDGSGFEKFATNGVAGTNPERDLAFVGNNLWVTARQAAPNLQEYDSTATTPVTATITGNSGHANAQTIALGNDGLLYVGASTGAAGWVTKFDPANPGTAGTNVYTGTAGSNALGMFLAPNATNPGGVLFSDYIGGTGSSGQIHVANATADVVFSFNGLADPLSATGGNLTGYKLDDLIVAPVPEPASLSLIGGAMLLVNRRRRATGVPTAGGAV